MKRPYLPKKCLSPVGKNMKLEDLFLGQKTPETGHNEYEAKYLNMVRSKLRTVCDTLQLCFENFFFSRLIVFCYFVPD